MKSIKMNWRQWSAALTVGLGVMMAASGPAAAKSYTMKLSMPTINDMQHEWGKMFKEELEKRTDKQIQVQIFPANQLGPIATVLEGMQLGSIESTITPFEFYVGIDPRFQIAAIPGLFTTMQEARTKLDNEQVRSTVLSIGEDKGIVGIGAVVYGPQVVVSRKPTAKLADFAHQKIRVLASETETGVISALGASPTPMPLNEVPAALQQGTIDGASTVLDVFVALRTYEVAPNAVDTSLWWTVSLASVSKVWFESLPEDLRKAVLDTAKDVEARMFTRQLERQSENEKRWRDAGGTLVVLPEDEQAKALELADKVAENFLAKNPALNEMYTMIKEAK